MAQEPHERRVLLYNRESVSGRRDQGLGEFFFPLSNSNKSPAACNLNPPLERAWSPAIRTLFKPVTGVGGRGGDLRDPLALDGLEGNGEDVAILPPAGREQQNTHAAAAAVDLRDNTL